MLLNVLEINAFKLNRSVLRVPLLKLVGGSHWEFRTAANFPLDAIIKL
jgi:hypothetical protein